MKPRARVLDAANLRELADALGGMARDDAASLAARHPSRAFLVDPVSDPARVVTVLRETGVPFARSGARLAWVADPQRAEQLHRRLRDDAPDVYEAASRAAAHWGAPATDVPLPDGRVLRLSDRVHVMGVVNVTPDSFSDGGKLLDRDAAVDHGLALAEEGADVLDIGGESTRPGSTPVPEEEELRRILPPVEGLAAKAGVPVSIDTRKASVARAALDTGAQIINDVSGGRDPKMFALAADRAAALILMHMRGEPATMQDDPRYDDVVGEVSAYLGDRVDAAIDAGVASERILVDPGFGFGKTREHNLVLLRRLRELRCLGHPVVAGTSRKGFIGTTLNLPIEERLEGTMATVALAVVNGAALVRVHDVAQARRVVQMVEAVLGAREPRGPGR